jgi:hypothetical protein
MSITNLTKALLRVSECHKLLALSKDIAKELKSLHDDLKALTRNRECLSTDQLALARVLRELTKTLLNTNRNTTTTTNRDTIIALSQLLDLDEFSETLCNSRSQSPPSSPSLLHSLVEAAEIKQSMDRLEFLNHQNLYSPPSATDTLPRDSPSFKQPIMAPKDCLEAQIVNKFVLARPRKVRYNNPTDLIDQSDSDFLENVDHRGQKNGREYASSIRDFLIRWVIRYRDNPYPSLRIKKKMAFTCGLVVKQVEDFLCNGIFHI